MVDHSKRIESALISVFHKDGLEPIVRELHRLDVYLYSNWAAPVRSSRASAFRSPRGVLSRLSRAFWEVA
jgi:phosphoribosylaminoimidazolecarboxamide formyltransferase/IMP cyclohydrolase